MGAAILRQETREKGVSIMKTNTILGIAALVLFVLSVMSYRQSVTRAERFERGQKFLAQLNPDEIDAIEIVKADKKTVLKRGDDSFSVVSIHDYPAKNETVNRFLNDALEIGLEKEIGKGESLEAELELAPKTEAATEFIFKNAAGKMLVHFMVGKTSEDGRGNYIKRLDGEDQNIYLTSKGVHLSAEGGNFLDKEIVDVQAANIASIQGKDFVIESTEGGDLKLKDVPAGKKEGAKVSQVKNLLAGLRFDNVFLADESEVASLNFDSVVDVKLKDQSSYQVSVAKSEDKHYLKISGSFAVDRISVSGEETEEELKEKSEVLSRGNKIQEFNEFHGSWVYQVSEFTANKFSYSKSDLLEEEEKETPSEG